jgi:hypothetical protein
VDLIYPTLLYTFLVQQIYCEYYCYFIRIFGRIYYLSTSGAYVKFLTHNYIVTHSLHICSFGLTNNILHNTGMFLHTKFHTPSSNSSVVNDSRLKAKYNFRMATMLLLYILRNKLPKPSCILSRV